MSWHTGRAWFDRAGKLSTTGAETVWFDDALPTGATLISPSASSATWTDGGIACDFAFTGHYRHAKSGLHLALYRAYDAGLGRWLSRDPIAEDGGINLYGYVKNVPTMFADSLGLLVDDGSKERAQLRVLPCNIAIFVGHDGNISWITGDKNSAAGSFISCYGGTGSGQLRNDIPIDGSGAGKITGLISIWEASSVVNAEVEAAKKHAKKLCRSSTCKVITITIVCRLNKWTELLGAGYSNLWCGRQFTVCCP
jgi:RHS repeat-associated protein